MATDKNTKKTSEESAEVSTATAVSAPAAAAAASSVNMGEPGTPTLMEVSLGKKKLRINGGSFTFVTGEVLTAQDIADLEAEKLAELYEKHPGIFIEIFDAK